MALEEIDVPLAEVTVQSMDGDPVRVGDLVDRPAVLVIPRYYGCLPCRAYLRDMSDRMGEVEAAGGAVLAVSVGGAHQARWLVEKKGCGCRCWSTRSGASMPRSTCPAVGGWA